MEATAPRTSSTARAATRRAVALPAVSAWVLSFALVAYLGLRGGGYDVIVRNEVGIAAWWLVLVGLVVGLGREVRTTRLAAVAWVAILALAAWTTLGLAWTESSERTVAEISRVAMYLGTFTLALFAVMRAGARPVLNGAFCAIALIAGVALVSRLEPTAFAAAGETGQFLPYIANRLAYPLNYWNGLAALVAMGLPLALWVAHDARTAVARALAAASVPALLLVLFLTFSRGGTAAAIVGTLTLLALSPGRGWHLLTLAAGGAGGAILIVAAADRTAIEDGLRNAAAERQGDELMAYLVVVMAGVALASVAISLAERHLGAPRALTALARRRRPIAIGIAALAVVGALAVGAPGTVSDRWQEFKSPSLEVGEGQVNRISRFQSASGSGRYQYWESAVDASAAEPVGGIGAGTFEYWWARNGSIPGFIRDAHSLYLETLAELGWIGLALLSIALLTALIGGAARSLRAGPLGGPTLAAATAGIAAFMTSASVDWVWEIAVLPCILFLLIAVVLGARRWSYRDDERPGAGRVRNVAVAAASVAALVALAIPLTSSGEVRRSQEAAQADELAQALSHAQRASEVAPYAATPDLQRALILEAAGDLPRAATAARAATEAEPTNWRTWLTLARIETFRGDAKAGLAAYDEAKSLNPRSPLFRGDR